MSVEITYWARWRGDVRLFKASQRVALQPGQARADVIRHFATNLDMRRQVLLTVIQYQEIEQ